MQADKFKELIDKYLDESIRVEEKQLLAGMLQDPAYIRLLDEMVLGSLASRTYELETDHTIKASIDQYLHEKINTAGDAGMPPAHIISRARFWNTSWFRVAAVVAVLFGIGMYFRMANRKDAPAIVKNEKLFHTDIQPGHEGAVLTLANGEKVVLDSMDNGVVTAQNGAMVLLKDGELSYNKREEGTVGYHTLTTPRGRQFQVRLPDGSRVWLNAASSITYPTVFTGSERSVQVTGEAYFEIEKNALMPFRVKMDNGSGIDVLGTRFNVKAYPDDKIVQATLLEGAVRVNAGNHQLTMKPGEQVQWQPDGNIALNANADIEKTTAWKDGIFDFEDVPFGEVMRQLERWYDIEVKYAGTPPSIHFKGRLPQDLALSQVIETLREVGVNFSIEGRTLTVMP